VDCLRNCLAVIRIPRRLDDGAVLPRPALSDKTTSTKPFIRWMATKAALEPRVWLGIMKRLRFAPSQLGRQLFISSLAAVATCLAPAVQALQCVDSSWHKLNKNNDGVSVNTYLSNSTTDHAYSAWIIEDGVVKANRSTLSPGNELTFMADLTAGSDQEAKFATSLEFGTSAT
jgi:hypothetical protein